MSTFSGKPVSVAMSAESAFRKLNNIEALQELAAQLPDEARAKMGDLSFTHDSIIIGTPQVGNIELKAVDRVEPSLIRFQAMQSPVPISLSINIAPVSDASCDVTAAIDVEIPAMLRPLIGGKMQEAADKFGELLTLILAH